MGFCFKVVKKKVPGTFFRHKISATNFTIKKDGPKQPRFFGFIDRLKLTQRVSLTSINIITCSRFWFIKTMFFKLTRMRLTIPCWRAWTMRIKIPKSIFCWVFSPIIQIFLPIFFQKFLLFDKIHSLFELLQRKNFLLALEK